MPICEKCGKPLPEGERFCPACGAVSDPNRQPAPHDAVLRPPKGSPYAVIGSWSFAGTILLLSVPVVGFIFAIVWACGGAHNRNRRNFARAYLLLCAIAIVLYLVLIFVFNINIDTISEIVSY